MLLYMFMHVCVWISFIPIRHVWKEEIHRWHALYIYDALHPPLLCVQCARGCRLLGGGRKFISMENMCVCVVLVGLSVCFVFPRTIQNLGYNVLCFISFQKCMYVHIYEYMEKMF